jgi:hypothetical protein
MCPGEADEDAKDIESGRALVLLGSDTLAASAGAAAGAFLGPVGAIGGAAAAPVLTRYLRKAGHAIQRRLLSENEEVRIGGALAVALGRIKQRLDAGEQPRADGVFDPDTDHRGMLEGTLLSAARSYDDKKVPFIGAFYASFVFDDSIPVSTAQFLLGLLERLTYHSLCALAYFADTENLAERLSMQVNAEEEGHWTPSFVIAELAELANLGLLGFKQEDGEVVNPMATFGSAPITATTAAKTTTTDLADTLIHLAELDKLPEADKLEIGSELRAGAPLSS